MNEQQKQKEIEKIVSICKENDIEYDISKLYFVEKDTKNYVNKDSYTLLVIKEGELLKLYGFYSINKVYCYFKKIQEDQNKNVIYLNNKELAGFVFIDNIYSLQVFIDFYITYENINYKELIEEPISNTSDSIANEMYFMYIYHKKETKYILFDHLKDQKYLINRDIGGKIIMCLDTKGKTLLDVAVNISNTPQETLRRCLNMFGFQWSNGKQQKCCIPVDTKTFKEYYLPFHILTKGRKYENSVNFLKDLYNFYNISSPNNEEEAERFKEKIFEICTNKQHLSSTLLEKHATYPRAIK